MNYELNIVQKGLKSTFKTSMKSTHLQHGLQAGAHVCGVVEMAKLQKEAKVLFQDLNKECRLAPRYKRS